ncbi:hypothetical protein BH11ACT5_BH11ACT5_25510 [soil metagenome]
MEGYTDVMACHLAGITTAVATCGTAFGVDHIKIVRRVIGDVENADTTGTGEVIFTFDPDEAGQKAASRAFAEEQRFAAQTFVAVAPDGLDPCDLRLKQGDGAVQRLIKSRKPMFEFMIRRQLAAHDLETVEGRVAALRAAAPVVAGIRDQALSIGYVRNLAGWLGMDPTEVQRAVRASGGPAPSRPPEREAAPETPPTEDEPSITRLRTDTTTRTERDVLMAILQHPDHVGERLMGKAMRIGFTDGDLGVVRDAIAVNLSMALAPDWASRVTSEVPQRFGKLVNELTVAPIPAREDKMAGYCRSIVTDFIDRDLLREKVELMGAMQRLDATADAERYSAVQRDLVRIETERRALRAE